MLLLPSLYLQINEDFPCQQTPYGLQGAGGSTQFYAREGEEKTDNAKLRIKHGKQPVLREPQKMVAGP